MKLSQLKQIIKEEVRKVLNEKYFKHATNIPQLSNLLNEIPDTIGGVNVPVKVSDTEGSKTTPIFTADNPNWRKQVMAHIKKLVAGKDIETYTVMEQTGRKDEPIMYTILITTVAGAEFTAKMSSGAYGPLD